MRVALSFIYLQSIAAYSGRAGKDPIATAICGDEANPVVLGLRGPRGTAQGRACGAVLKGLEIKVGPAS